MQNYIINVVQIEELQTTNDVDELYRIFGKAKSTIVNGEQVLLVRKFPDGHSEKFDQLTTLEDLEMYQKRIFKYLKVQ
ncbi:MAG TPA: hypothetical protein VFQ58_00220 [Flavisolibacter sp.]|nr:hypothetical protein [Flavisolibacter sp.]